jgi:hypothetical protein
MVMNRPKVCTTRGVRTTKASSCNLWGHTCWCLWLVPNSHNFADHKQNESRQDAQFFLDGRQIQRDSMILRVSMETSSLTEKTVRSHSYSHCLPLRMGRWLTQALKAIKTLSGWNVYTTRCARQYVLILAVMTRTEHDKTQFRWSIFTCLSSCFDHRMLRLSLVFSKDVFPDPWTPSREHISIYYRRPCHEVKWVYSCQSLTHVPVCEP